jgi:hypothetical protein
VETKYCPANLSKIVTGCKLLNTTQQQRMYKLLNKFAHLFDGTLGNLKTDPVDLELKESHIQFYTLKNNS